MKRNKLLLLPFLAALLLFAGCSRESADDPVIARINDLKEGKSDNFSGLLQEGIEKSNDSYVLAFPDGLKNSYLGLLQDSFNTISFEVGKPEKKKKDAYTVKVEFAPINVGETLASSSSEYIASMESSDLETEVSAMLKENSAVLKKSPVYQPKTSSTFHVKKSEDGFVVEEKEINSFLKKALVGYMAPYDTVCDILNVQDFMASYLDASFKGEVGQFAKHTEQTEEEALAWYETDTFTPPSDLSSAYTERYQNALKNILKQSKYTVGIPKTDAAGYTIDVTVTPNNSFTDAYREFEQGLYYSIDEASAGLVQAMEKYATAPTYGTETTVTVPWNASTILASGDADSEFGTLATTILPTPQ